MSRVGIVKIGLTIGIILLFVTYHIFNPFYSPLFPKCPSIILTGYKCAGCGSQRAIHHLLNLEIIDAFKMNPLLAIIIPIILIIVWLEYLGGKKTAVKLNNMIQNKYFSLILLFVFISYTILRNLFDF